MTTQTQGKGKKKNKEVTKVSLDEFNAFEAPHGHSVVSVKMTTGLDWAATMADENLATETQQIVVPIAPRAQRGPNIDYDSISDTPPFKASLYNLPMSAEDKDVSDRFFQGLGVKRVEITKSTTTVEFESKQDLYDALCKDGTSFKGKTVNVCLFGQAPQNNYQDRFGGRGGNSSYGDRGGFGDSRMGDRYGDRSGGYDNRDREGGFSGYNRGGSGAGGFGGSRGGGGGYGDRFQDRGNFRENPRGPYTSGGGEPEAQEPENWRAGPKVRAPPPPQESSYNNGSRQPYIPSRSDPPHYQQAPSHHQQYQHESYHQSRYNQHNQPSNHSPHIFHNDRPNNRPPYNSAAPSAVAPGEERPKLMLKPRKTPLNIDDVSTVSRNEAIFGKAKPTATPYEKMKEVEEKLKSVQISDRKSSHSGSQACSQPGSAPRSRHVSERSRE